MKELEMMWDDEQEQEDHNFSRFDFEQQVMRCWSIEEDIQEVIWLLEDENKFSQHDVQFIKLVLTGMKGLCNMRFNTLFKMFEEGVNKGRIL